MEEMTPTDHGDEVDGLSGCPALDDLNDLILTLQRSMRFYMNRLMGCFSYYSGLTEKTSRDESISPHRTHHSCKSCHLGKNRNDYRKDKDDRECQHDSDYYERPIS